MATAKTKLRIEDYNEEKAFLEGRLAAENALRNAELNSERALSEAETAKALRSKYIENRFSAKRLPQIAAAKGLSGGGVKNAFRDLEGNYSAVRANLEAERNSAIAKLVAKYEREGMKDSGSYADKLMALKRKYAEVIAEEERRKNRSYSSGGSSGGRGVRVIHIGG